MKNEFVLCLSLIAAAAPLRAQSAAPGALPKDLQEFAGANQAATPPATPASAPAAASAQTETKAGPVTEGQKLLARTAADLESVYRASQPGPIPEGASQGTGTVSPGTEEGQASQELISYLWQGKIFVRIDDSSGTLVNKTVFGDTFDAKVYFGQSRLDGKDSIIIDYSETSYKPFRIIRDEIRRIAPGVYLGYAFLNGVDKAPIVFALDFNAPKGE